MARLIPSRLWARRGLMDVIGEGPLKAWTMCFGRKTGMHRQASVVRP
jgi:hypothetical protein